MPGLQGADDGNARGAAAEEPGAAASQELGATAGERLRAAAAEDLGAAAGEDLRATAAVLAILKTASWLLDEVQPVFAEHRITASRFDALEALSRRGGRARPAELRDVLHLPAQTLTGVLDQLAAAGFVRRSPNPADRRSILVELTAAGQAALDRICPPLIEIEEDCMATLSDAELRRITDLLARVQSRIAQRRAAGIAAP